MFDLEDFIRGAKDQFSRDAAGHDSISSAFMAGLEPTAHTCKSRSELGDWFRGFAGACRRARQ